MFNFQNEYKVLNLRVSAERTAVLSLPASPFLTITLLFPPSGPKNTILRFVVKFFPPDHTQLMEELTR